MVCYGLALPVPEVQRRWELRKRIICVRRGGDSAASCMPAQWGCPRHTFRPALLQVLWSGLSKWWLRPDSVLPVLFN